jgi:DNA-binding MarR family transcriptional regulator
MNRTELRNWFKLVGGMMALLETLDRQMRDRSGISHDDYLILSFLYRAPGRTLVMSDLARTGSYSPSRLTHAVSRLEGEGWVTRGKSETDRRMVEATLTDAGAVEVESVSTTHLALVKALVFDTLGPERARDAANAMDEVRRASRALP